jgi:hypothetical protein
MLAGILPGLLTVDAPSALRIVEAAPAVYGVAALGLVAVWERGVRTWSGRSKALVAAVLASAIAWNGWTYFARMYDSPLVWISSAAIGTQVGRRLQELRRAGTLPEKMLLAVPRSFFEDPDNRFVLAFFCPRGLKLGIYDDPVPLERPADALLLPNDEELWRLAAARDAHYAVQLARARLAEAEWLRRSNSPYRPSILTGPPFPGTRAPTFWLYIRRPEDERTAERQEPR